MLMRDGTIHMDRLVTYGCAPGYRDVHLVIEIDKGGRKERVTLYFTPEDAVDIMQHIRHTNEIAWRNGPPLDAKEGEQRPSWLTHPA